MRQSSSRKVFKLLITYLAHSRYRRVKVPIEPPVFPIDIFELIIDFAAVEVPGQSAWAPDAFKTLEACSLTCRTWTPRSQHHLFRFLAVRCEPQRIKDVVGLLTTHVALRKRVEMLVVKTNLAQTVHDLPPELPELLAGVPELRLLGCCIIVPTPKLLASLRLFTAVTTLDLQDTEFNTCADLCQVITTFDALKTLLLSFVQFRTTFAQPHGGLLPTHVRLHTLYVATNASWLAHLHTIAFFEWLAHSGIVSTAENLRFQNLMIMNDAVFDAVRTVLETAAATVEELSLHPGPNLSYDSLSDVLQRCPKLSLLSLFVPYRVSDYAPLLSFLARCDVHMPSLYLSFVEYPHCVPPTSVEWARLDAVLQLPPWDALDVLYVDLAPRDVSPERFKWGEFYGPALFDANVRARVFREGLPMTRARGIVEQWRGYWVGYVLL